MVIVGADVKMPLGRPWRVGKHPFRDAALRVAASCHRGFYLYLNAAGKIGPELADESNGNLVVTRDAGGWGFDGRG